MKIGTRLALVTVLASTVSSVGAQTAKGVTLNTQVGEEIRYLDPQKATGISSSHIGINLFLGLFEYGHKDSEPTPSLVKSQTHSDDFVEWTFKLRDDVPWVSYENGKAVKHRMVNAHDVVYSYQRMLSPELASEYAYMLYILKNGEAFNKGEIKDKTKIGVQALDDYTVKLTLEGPVPTLVRYLPHHSFHIVPKEPIEKYGDQWIEAGKIWTNGPFAFKDWKLKERISIVKNPYFPEAKDVQLEEVNFKFIGTYSAEAVRAFRAGEVDVDFNPPPANDLKELMHEKSLLLAKQLGTYFVRVNTNRKGLDDPRVRQALALTIPRDEIVRYVMKSGQTPTYSFIPDAFKGYKPALLTESKGDEKARVEKARKLLADAGYPGGKGFPSFAYVYNTSETHKKVAVVLAKEWKKQLGIDIKPLNEEWKVYLNNQKNMNYDMQRAGWVADMEDPMNFAEMFITKGGNNNTGWGNKRYDELITKARVEGDVSKRNELIATAERILMDELPILPIFNYVSVNLRQPYISGFYANKLDQHPLRFVRIDEQLRRKMFKK